MLTVSNSRRNPFQMYLPPQVLSPCPWNVPQLEGGRGLFAVAFGARGLGAVTPQGLAGGVFGLMKIFVIGCEKSFRNLTSPVSLRSAYFCKYGLLIT